MSGLDMFHCTSIDLIYSFFVGMTKTIEAPPIVVPTRIYGGNGSVGDLHIIWTVSDQVKIRFIDRCLMPTYQYFVPCKSSCLFYLFLIYFFDDTQHLDWGHVT